jgi:hypothetical protein
LTIYCPKRFNNTAKGGQAVSTLYERNGYPVFAGAYAPVSQGQGDGRRCHTALLSAVVVPGWTTSLFAGI